MDGQRDGVGIEHVLLGDIWVGRFDRGWAAARGASWYEGYYDTRETAIEAAEQFTDSQIRTLRPVWAMDGENRPATMADLDTLSRSLPPPWYWRFVRIRRVVIWLDRRLPKWANPWITTDS